MTLLVGCMMVQNAAELLRLSLGTLRGQVDELVIVDGGSQDATKTIALDFGATVIDSPWTGNFSAQRQVYLDFAVTHFAGKSSAWAFVLDADEIVVLGNAGAAVRGLERQGMDHATVPRMWLVKTPEGLRYLASRPHHPDYQLRLLKLRPGVWYAGSPHEVIHGLRSGTKVDQPALLHLDLTRVEPAVQAEKVKRYEKLEPGAGVPRFYLFQRYGFKLRPLPDDDSITPLLPQIDQAVRVSLSQDDLRGKELQYRLTVRLAEFNEWAQLKAKRLLRRVRRLARPQ